MCVCLCVCLCVVCVCVCLFVCVFTNNSDKRVLNSAENDVGWDFDWEYGCLLITMITNYYSKPRSYNVRRSK